MTKEELLIASKEMVKALKRSEKNDGEIDINGNGYSWAEASGAIDWYHKLIVKYVKANEKTKN